MYSKSAQWFRRRLDLNTCDIWSIVRLYKIPPYISNYYSLLSNLPCHNHMHNWIIHFGRLATWPNLRCLVYCTLGIPYCRERQIMAILQFTAHVKQTRHAKRALTNYEKFDNGYIYMHSSWTWWVREHTLPHVKHLQSRVRTTVVIIETSTAWWGHAQDP
jgi:hypothetical protein